VHKVRRLHIYLALAAALAIHLTFLNKLMIFGARPDLILIVVVFFALFRDWRMGLELGLISGLLKDLFAFDLFGVNTLVLGVVGFSAGVMNAKLFRESRMTQFISVFALAAFSMWFHYFVISFRSKGSYLITLSDYLFFSVLPASIYTALVSVPIFAKFIAIYNLTDSEYFL